MKIKSIESLETDTIFNVSNLELELNNGQTEYLLKTDLNYHKALNVSFPTFRLEMPLEISEGPIVVGPVAYKTGEYRCAYFTPRDLDLMYPARTTKGICYGPSEIIDRFPGFSKVTIITDIDKYVCDCWDDELQRFVSIENIG